MRWPFGSQFLAHCKDYVTRLSLLSESLAEKTVYRPNELEQSIDQSFFLSHVPNVLIETQDTLYATLKQVDGAVSSTSATSTDPVRSDSIVNKVQGIANLTFQTAYSIDQGGATRRRLLQDSDVRATFADVLLRTLLYVYQIRIQQEGCGYGGRQSTEYPENLMDAVERSQVAVESALLPGGPEDANLRFPHRGHHIAPSAIPQPPQSCCRMAGNMALEHNSKSPTRLV